MITTKDLESLGWKHSSTATNGGTKLFMKGLYTEKDRPYINYYQYHIFSNADNSIMKNRNSPDYEKITINKVGPGKSTEIWVGIPKDIQDLKRILVETGADMEWLPELRDEKINDILNDNN
jgi:hypothetical protein